MDKYELRESGLVSSLSANESEPRLPGISRFAEFLGSLTLGGYVRIENAVVGSHCIFEEGVHIREKARIGHGVHLEHAVQIGKQATVMHNCRVGQSSEIDDLAIVGDNLTLTQETQIGKGMVIPSPKTIVTLGRFGTSRRMVTIHGSDDGPHFSIGGQHSVPEAVITNRILAGTATSAYSAGHYREYLPKFSAIGARVQRFYDKESEHVEDLRAKALELTKTES